MLWNIYPMATGGDKHSIICFYEKYKKTVNQSVFSNAASSSAFLSVFQHRVSMRQ